MASIVTSSSSTSASTSGMAATVTGSGTTSTNTSTSTTMDRQVYERTWDLIHRYFGHAKGEVLVKHLLDSFNDFATRKLDDIISGFNPIEVCSGYLPDSDCFKYVISMEVKQPTLSKPTIHEKDGSTKLMTPADARNRNFTYAAPLAVSVVATLKVFNTETGEYVVEQKRLNNVSLGRVPIMVNSKYCILQSGNSCVPGECRYDFGGYFIVNGNEKVVISQDRIAENKTYVFNNSKLTPAYSLVAEIRSVLEQRFSVPKVTSLKLSSKPNEFGRFIRVNLHHVKADVPLFVLFRALGLDSDKEILSFVCHDVDDPENAALLRELAGSVEEGSSVQTMREAHEYLAKHMTISGYPKELLYNKAHRLEILRNVLRTDFLPHVGEDLKKKALYLGFMANKLLRCHIGTLPFDDRDSYINKRVDTPGVLVASLFRQYYGKVVKDLKNGLQKEINTGAWKATRQFSNIITPISINKLIKSTTIESGLKYGLSTGNWGIQAAKSKQGVAQVLNRMTYNSMISHLRRINTPIEKTGKLVQPRKLHSTQWGIICPNETPEGVSVGLVKNMSLVANITVASTSSGLRELLVGELGAQPFEGNPAIFARARGATKVLVNGDIVGVHLEPAELCRRLRAMKRSGAISVFTSICWNIYRGEVSLCTEAGRCVRPLFVVHTQSDAGTATPSDCLEAKTVPALEVELPKDAAWVDLVVDDRQLIEYLDVEECNHAMLAMRYSDLSRGIKGSSYPPRYTHLELDMSITMGALAASIPFSEHNQAPRNCYQCLWVEEEVLMADGSRKMIKDVREGDEVVTFDLKTMETSVTKVVHQYIRQTTKQVFEVTTVSGRRINATFDHKFMTSEGWKAVADFEDDTLVSVHPTLTQVPHSHMAAAAPASSNFGSGSDYGSESDTDSSTGAVVNHDSTSTVGERVVLDEDYMARLLMAMHVPPGNVARHTSEMHARGLLPILSLQPNLPRLAALCGYLFAKGEWQVGATGPQLLVEFGSKDDAQRFETDVQAVGLPHVKVQGTRLCHSGLLCAVALSLGAGNRDSVPDWIMRGTPAVKREFLAGFQGGMENACFSTAKGSVSCVGSTLYVNRKQAQQVGNVVEQMRGLLLGLGVQAQVSSKDVRFDRSIHITLKVQDDPANLLRYAEAVGYRYNAMASRSSMLLGEYLRCITARQGLRVPLSWFLTRVQVRGDMLFVPVGTRRAVDDMTLISDITVESDNHSFVGGQGFGVSNSAMGKQAIGVYTSNFRDRYDTLGHVLNYPQQPFVATRASKLVNADKLPSGINVIVAIATYTGFNMEDSVIMNKSSVDRGLFHSTYFRTYREQNNKNHSTGEEEYFCKPESTVTNQNKKPFNYAKLDDHGFVAENTYVETGDVVIGKCMPQKNGSVINYKDTSMVLKNNESGFVDRNCYNDSHFVNTNGDGYSFAKVRLRSDRIPCIGDKFCLPGIAEVLTIDGWKPIQSVTRNDIVAQLDPATHELTFVHPTEVYQFDHDGQMYHVHGHAVDLVTTMDHKMFVQLEGEDKHDLVPARELVGRTGTAYAKAGRYALDEVPSNLDVFGMDPLLAARLYGCFMRSGSIDILHQQPRAVCLTACPQDLWQAAAQQSWACKLDTTDGKLMVWEPAVVALCEAAQANVGYMAWLRACSPIARTFVDALLHPIEGYALVQDLGKQRADELQILALLAGYAADVQLQAGSQRAYTVQVYRSGMNSMRMFQDCHDKVLRFVGKVYCIEVPHHVFYVRMNGKAVWTGNSSRHAQKGTMGIMYSQEDMPFTAEGLVPDIILNPHAIPSRMTIAQLMECIMSKACCALGTYGDGTPFTNLSVEELAQALEKCGLERYGNEVMYNSRTGEQMNTTIFIGPTYYQRLKHMVNDKCHSRSANGPVVMLTRQPAEGRARDGGLRLGEMEVECNWAHGTMAFLKERMMECSDNYRVFVCNKCGMMANVNPEKQLRQCKPCNNTTAFSEVRIPYACKLLFQEVQTMGIATKFTTA